VRECETSPAARTPQTIGELIAFRAERAAGKTAILAPGRGELASNRLHAQVEAVVETLNLAGIGRGDRVAVVLPNGPDMAVAFLGVTAAATCAPLNPAYRAPEFEFYLLDLDVRALVLPAGADLPAREVAYARSIPVLELVPGEEAGTFTLEGRGSGKPNAGGPAAPDDVALVLHTSGTTSRPKIVPLTHTNLCASARNIRFSLELTAADRCLNVLPLFHIHGLMAGLLASLAA